MCPQTKQFLQIELCQKLSDQVGSATTLSQRKCQICGSKNHLLKDCPRENQQAIDAGRAAEGSWASHQEVVQLSPNEKTKEKKVSLRSLDRENHEDLHHAGLSAKCHEF